MLQSLGELTTNSTNRYPRVRSLQGTYRIENSLAMSHPDAQPYLHLQLHLHPHVSPKSLHMWRLTQPKPLKDILSTTPSNP